MRRLLLLIWIAATSSRAYAQSAEAEQLFNDGDKDLKLGKLEPACDAFEASNRIEARAGTLIRLGQCREQLHQLASAWSAYKDAATRAKDPNKRKIADARIAALEPLLSHLTIRVADRVDGLELARDGKPIDPGLWDHAIPINGGEYEITATAAGHAEWTKTVRIPNERGAIVVEVPALEAVAAPVVKPKPVESPVKPTVIVEQPTGVMSTRRGVAIGLVVVGAGAVVSGALLGHSAQAKRDDAYALCPDPSTACTGASTANSLISTAHTRALEADVAFGAGALAAIIATTLWATGAPEHPTVTAQMSAHGGGFAIAGSW